MGAFHYNVESAFLIEHLNQPLVHLQSNMLTFTGAFLHKSEIRSGQNIQVVVMRVGNLFQHFGISSGVSSVPDMSCEWIGITNNQPICPHYHVIFPICLPFGNLYNLVDIPLVHRRSITPPLPIPSSMFRHPYRLIMLCQGLGQVVVPLNSTPMTQTRLAKYAVAGGVSMGQRVERSCRS